MLYEAFSNLDVDLKRNILVETNFQNDIKMLSKLLVLAKGDHSYMKKILTKYPCIQFAAFNENLTI